MKTIDFKHFKMFTDITQERTTEQDLHKDFADLLYKKVNGVAAHDLALRIYRADGPVELSDEDMMVIHEFLRGATPIFMDSFENNIKEQ